MARHLRISCPSCRREGLRVKPEHLGRHVQCKHCGQTFRASGKEASAPSPRPAAEASIHPAQIGDAAEVGETAGGKWGTATRDEGEGAGAELARLRDQVESLEGRGAEADRLVAELEAGDAKVRRLQSELEAGDAEVRRLQSELESRAAEAGRLGRLAQDAASLRAERDQLQESVRASRDELHDRTAELERFGPLVGELEALRSEHERLRGEAAGYRAELEARAILERPESTAEPIEAIRAERDRLAALREADACVAEEFLSRLAELERALDEAERGLEAERRRGEAELQGLRGDWDRERQSLIDDGERRLAEELGRAAGERRDWSAQLATAVSRAELGGEALRAEAERYRLESEALGRDRDLLAARYGALEGAGLQAEQSLRAQVDRAARELDEAGRRADALVQQRDELAGRVEHMQTEVDRHCRDREEVGRVHELALAALRRDRDKAFERVARLEESLENLEHQLADAVGRCRAADERADRLDAELQAAAAPPRPGEGPTVENLTLQLSQARAAIERLRALLDVFGFAPSDVS